MAGGRSDLGPKPVRSFAVKESQTFWHGYGGVGDVVVCRGLCAGGVPHGEAFGRRLRRRPQPRDTILYHRLCTPKLTPAPTPAQQRVSDCGGRNATQMGSRGLGG